MSSPQTFWSAITDTPQPLGIADAFVGALRCGVSFGTLPDPLKDAITRMQEAYVALEIERMAAASAKNSNDFDEEPSASRASAPTASPSDGEVAATEISPTLAAEARDP